MRRVYVFLMMWSLVGVAACSSDAQDGAGATAECPDATSVEDTAADAGVLDADAVTDAADATDATDTADVAPAAITAPQIAIPRDHLVWPLSGTDRPAGRMSSTFGPRLKASDGDRYDFHRGIDLPTPVGTPIHAVQDGTVRLAGHDPKYDDPVIQIEHHTAANEVYYSNYLHVATWDVTPGQQVSQGEVIGTTGTSASGFAHLHFEIREGDVFHQNCVHPLLYLPYPNHQLPQIDIQRVQAVAAGTVQVAFSVELPTDELDLNRVMVGAIDPTTGELVGADQFNMTRANHLYEDRAVLDQPDFRPGLYIDPASFGTTDQRYHIGFTFDALPGSAQDRIVIAAEDVFGNRTTRVVEPH